MLGDSTLAGAIMQLVAKQISSAELVHLKTGQVTSVDPLRIKLDVTNIPIDDDNIILTDAAQIYTTRLHIDGVWKDVEIDNSLKLNDAVIMAAFEDGQTFVVLYKTEGEIVTE
jgi:hypothetical protein